MPYGVMALLGTFWANMSAHTLMSFILVLFWSPSFMTFLIFRYGRKHWYYIWYYTYFCHIMLHCQSSVLYYVNAHYMYCCVLYCTVYLQKQVQASRCQYLFKLKTIHLELDIIQRGFLGLQCAQSGTVGIDKFFIVFIVESFYFITQPILI